MKKIFKNACDSLKNNGVFTNLIIAMFSAIISFAICLVIKEPRWSNLVSAIILLVLFILITFILEFFVQRKKQKIKDYFSNINSPDFLKFTNDLMKHYYGEKYLTTLNYRDKDQKNQKCMIPVYCLRSGDDKVFSDIKDTKRICSELDKRLSDNGEFDIKDHQNYDNYEYYKKYKDIVGDKIKYPDRPGYMLDKILTKEQGDKKLIDRVSCHVGTFAENTYSSHTLEYELHKAYIRFRKEWESRQKKNTLEDESFWDKVKKSLKVRNKISNDNNGAVDSLLNGEGRHALLSVQMLVLCKSNSGEYEVKMIQRSQNVSIAPGEYQFVPCGYFEVFNDSEDGCYDKEELDDNFSPGSAVFREYLEELFQEKDFEGAGKGTVFESLLKDERINEINEKINGKEASLIFLGSALDLRILCHFLSFALIIEDVSYAQNQFIGNDEVRKGKIFSQSINHLNDYWGKMNFCSTALWYLFTQTKKYKDIMENNGKNNNS